LTSPARTQKHETAQQSAQYPKKWNGATTASEGERRGGHGAHPVVQEGDAVGLGRRLDAHVLPHRRRRRVVWWTRPGAHWATAPTEWEARGGWRRARHTEAETSGPAFVVA
jgi:hypothetical protein